MLSRKMHGIGGIPTAIGQDRGKSKTFIAINLSVSRLVTSNTG